MTRVFFIQIVLELRREVFSKYDSSNSIHLPQVGTRQNLRGTTSAGAGGISERSEFHVGWTASSRACKCPPSGHSARYSRL